MQNAETKPKTKRRTWPRLRYIFAAILIVATPITYLVLSGRPVMMPAWVTERLEEKLNTGLGTAGRMSLGWTSVVIDRTLRPQVRLGNVGLFDARGSEIARLNAVGARLAPAPVTEGALTLRELALSGAQITVVRLTDGTLDLSIGAGIEASGTLAGVLDAIDQTFAAGPMTALERISADEVTITLEDHRSGRIWQVTEGRVTLDHGAESIDLTVAADVFNGTEDLASTVIGFRTEKGSPKATLTATFENAAAGDIALQSPALAFLGVLDAPISGALATSIGSDGVMERLAGSLEIGGGVLQPTPGTKPIRFDKGRAYVTYDPETQMLDFSEISFETDAARARASGRAALTEFRAGWPTTMVGQLSVSDVVAQPEDLLAEPAVFNAGATDFRLRLDPFTLEIGQLALQTEDRRFHGSGRIAAAPDGWDVALDLSLNTIPLDRMLALWPVDASPGARRWIAENVRAAEFRDLTGVWRQAPGATPVFALNYAFEKAELRYLKHFPPITLASGYASIVDHGFSSVVESGVIEAPQGGFVDIAGSVFRVGDMRRKPGRAEIGLRLDGAIPAVLSLLDLKPFELIKRAQKTPDLAQGRARMNADLAFDLVDNMKPEDVDYTVSGDLTGVRSDTLVPNRTVTADGLRVQADRAGISITGPGKLGQVPFDVTWSQGFAPGEGRQSRIDGTVVLSQAFLDEFNIALPPGSVSGEGRAQITVELERDAPARFQLVSDLNRLGLRLSALDWSKAPASTGRLEVAGTLGEIPEISRLTLDAPGLDATGRVRLGEGGAFIAAVFDRVRAGGWLDAPVTLTGRGPGAAPAIAIAAGTLDMRQAAFGGGGGGGGGGGRSGPMTVELDRLIVSQGIVLNVFRGQFETGRGLDGTFTARVNGGAPIEGQLVPTRNGTAVRIKSARAGQVLADAGILRNARGGDMDMTLNPTGARGEYDGVLRVSQSRIVEAPALTELLSAISIIGLLDQMNSGGITLSDTEAVFRLSPERLSLYRSSAVGPSIGISLDGVYDLKAGRIDMQGVISPVYFLNAVGQVFTRQGEGLFGFNFRLTGDGQNPRVQVNPLSILTPGTFREIFRRAPPQRASQ